VQITQARLGAALSWAREQRLSAEDNLSYLREFEHITLARILLAQYKNDREESSIREALGFLERLLNAAQAGGRMGSVIEILLLQALAHQAQGDISAALLPLGQALTLAEPEGYVRVFLDEGANMAQLLREAASRGIMPNYIGKLLTAFETKEETSVASASKSPLPTSSVSQPLIDPLSQRELEVLRLFRTELSGPEIAHELTIALSTVRTHTESIYSKLHVKTRRGAVKRAIELKLI
jgi:LuxR family maltose regulon positive regulatory protein